MKKSYLIMALLGFVCLQAYSKKNLVATASFSYNNGFQPADTVIYSYHIGSGYDSALGTWNADSIVRVGLSPGVTPESYETNTFNSNKKVAVRNALYLQGSNIQTVRTEYFYTPTGKMDHYIVSSHIATISDSFRVGYTYNSQDDITGWTKERWDANNTQWVNDSRETYTYSSGIPQSRTQEMWNNTTLLWEGVLRYSYQYAGGKLQYEQIEEYAQGNWDLWQRNESMYDANGFRNGMEIMKWDKNSQLWMPDTKVADTNSATGELLNGTLYTYDGSTYAAQSRTEYSYNSDKQVTVSTDFTWDAGSNTFTHDAVNQEWHYHYADPLGIEDNTTLAQTQLMVYPVPATNTLFVDAGNTPAMPIRLVIYDAAGKTVKNIMLGNTAQSLHGIDVSNLAPGNYILQANAGTTNIVQRISISR